MTDITATLEIAGTILLVAVLIIVFSWLLAGSEGPSLADIFAVPAGPPLPRGVQEEEPVRYRVERLSRPRASAVAQVNRAPAGRPVIETRPCG